MDLDNARLRNIIWQILFTVLLLATSGRAASVTVYKQPKSMSRNLSQDIVLSCIFEKPVLCWWTRDGYVVQVTGRYSYADDHSPKEDCSLKIRDLHWVDEGNWYCSGIRNGRVTHSMEAFIHVKEKQEVDGDPYQNQVVVHPQPEFQVELDQTYVLRCRFSQSALCYWEHNSAFVGSNPRVRFLGQYGNDCSISIQQLRRSDAGSWRCKSKATDSFDGAKTNEAVLTFKTVGIFGLSIWMILLIVIAGLATLIIIVAIITNSCKRKARTLTGSCKIEEKITDSQNSNPTSAAIQ